LYVLERSQHVRAPLSEVFAFFSDPANRARITPPWLRFRMVDAAPERIAAGSRFEYRIRWSLFRLGWVTRITRWEPPSQFQDVQEKGPYKTWIHTHRFAEEPGGVRMQDRVEYALRFGPLGRLAHRLRVRRQLEEIFDYRREAIEEIFAGGSRAVAADAGS
jgi:ligand-binding SRPBCC domain-containing protein